MNQLATYEWHCYRLYVVRVNRERIGVDQPHKLGKGRSDPIGRAFRNRVNYKK